jgi:chitin disaccharide deacetylase
VASDVRLIVRADDFGMCHAVNQGILHGFTEGIVTQSSVMVPCPWFTEAAALIAEHRIPVGVHQTLTCEWDYLRWRPITAGPSLVGEDGTFLRTVAEARDAITHADAVAELTAQAARFVAAGLDMQYLDIHMGAVAPDAYAAVAEDLGQLFLYSAVARSRGLSSIAGLSERDAVEKKPWLLAYLAGLTAGTHMLVCHPATGGDELRSITGDQSPVVRWAEEYRISDLAVVTDPEVRAAVAAHGIELTTVAETIARR